ncbi:hypothetical protein OEZ86_003207 [Tetradesmus obliquus]|nr:hypothetical protein OEZ86_003207 [Tetradesmus obliquus]
MKIAVLGEGPLCSPNPSHPQPAPATATAAAPAAAAAAASVVPLFSHQQLQATLDALTVVRYGQRLQLPGPWGLVAEARPAGSSIGAAMWTLMAGSQRVTYLSAASLWPNSSAPLHSRTLQQLDALLLGPGCLCPDLRLSPALHAIQHLLSPPELLLPAAAGAAARAVLGGGRVLVPVLPSGTAVLQLLEHILRALLAAAGPAAAAAAAATPLFYLSPAAPDALATASSCCEYLEEPRKQAVLFNGQAPFEFERQLEGGQLRLFTGLPADGQAAAADVGGPSAEEEFRFEGQVTPDYREALRQVEAAGPCVVFVPLWSLAAGPGQQLAEQWCSDPRNLLLLPEQGPLAAAWLQQCLQQQLLPPLQQQQWQADGVSLSSCSLITLLSKVSGPPPAPPPSSNSSSSSSSSSSAFSFQLVQLPDPLLQVHLSRDLAKSLHLTPLTTPAAAEAAAAAAAAAADANAQHNPAAGADLTNTAAAPSSSSSSQQVSVARVRALLTHQAGCWRLDPLPGGTTTAAVAAALQQQQESSAGMLWGSVELTPLLGELQAAGFTSLLLDSGTSTPDDGSPQEARIIKLTTAGGDAEIWLTGSGTEIVCDCWLLRKQLLELVMRQLHVVS